MGVEEWVARGGKEGELENLVRRSPPGVRVVTVTPTEAHTAWTTEAQAVHAYHRGRGWPELAGWNVAMSRVEAANGSSLPPGEAWMLQLTSDEAANEQGETPKGVKLAEVQRYLKTVAAPTEVVVDPNGRGCKVCSTRWRVMASGETADDWISSFGTKVDNTENKMTWAAGWTRYREEVENARKDEGRWKKNDIRGDNGDIS
jgi:hypothetical protein